MIHLKLLYSNHMVPWSPSTHSAGCKAGQYIQRRVAGSRNNDLNLKASRPRRRQTSVSKPVFSQSEFRLALYKAGEGAPCSTSQCVSGIGNGCSLTDSCSNGCSLTVALTNGCSLGGGACWAADQWLGGTARGHACLTPITAGVVRAFYLQRPYLTKKI